MDRFKIGNIWIIAEYTIEAITDGSDGEVVEFKSADYIKTWNEFINSEFNTEGWDPNNYLSITNKTHGYVVNNLDEYIDYGCTYHISTTSPSLDL